MFFWCVDGWDGALVNVCDLTVGFCDEDVWALREDATCVVVEAVWVVPSVCGVFCVVVVLAFVVIFCGVVVVLRYHCGFVLFGVLLIGEGVEGWRGFVRGDRGDGYACECEAGRGPA